MWVDAATLSYLTDQAKGFPPGLLKPDDPNNDDFELWSPSEEREERCLFGRQVRSARVHHPIGTPPLTLF